VGDVSQILAAIQQGDSKAAAELLPLVYTELRKLAAYKLANEAPGQTLQPTALVHEAWLRLGNDKEFEGRSHFFAAAAEAMRRILIDRARSKCAIRHGGNLERIELDKVDVAAPENDEELMAVNEALDKLATEHSAEAEVVKLRYFIGMTIEEAAEALGVSPRTAKYRWTHARAWLYREITKQSGAVGTPRPTPS